MGKHILIIGGGVIGLCAAHYCQARGHRVTVVERRSRIRDGCSFGNAGMVVPSHFVPLAAPGMVKLGLKWMWNPESPFYVKPRLSWHLMSWGWRFWRAANKGHVARCAPLLRDMQFASRALFEELAVQGHEFGLVTRGLVMLCQSQHVLDEEARMAEQARALGVPAEVLDVRGVAALDPDVTLNVAGGVYFPKDCHLNPGRFMQSLESGLARGGAEFLWDAEVTGFVKEGAAVMAVQTSKGEVAADEVVIAGGSWSPLLTRELDLRLPMQAGKGYSLTLTKPRQLPRLCSILTEARVAVTPMDGMLRFGGTMEIAGLNETITARRVQGIIKAALRYFPEFKEEDFAGIAPWRGLRPCSPDGMPYLGRTQRWQNVVVATGHAMMGLSMGPVSGLVAAQVLDGEAPSHDLTLLAPDRYA
jgi:D-amino-acid dehydrogenase